MMLQRGYSNDPNLAVQEMSAYYNEWEPYPAQWLRNLIKGGLIADGEVDERSIKDVKADDLKNFTQCHFFAGIGGWSGALRLAGWPDERPVWTGSCPCQPFSVAGSHKGKEDDRHLWPQWMHHIRECNPSTIFGEQVTGAIAHGWFDDVVEGLEKEGYAVGAAVIPACGVGAPHRRERLWFVAHSGSAGRRKRLLCQRENNEQPLKEGRSIISSQPSETPTSMAYAKSQRCRKKRPDSQRPTERPAFGSDVSNTDRRSLERPSVSRSECDFWEFEPSVGRVANGIPARAYKLRAYGNAIVPQVAQAFIEAFMECRP